MFNELDEVEGLSFWKDPAPGEDNQAVVLQYKSGPGKDNQAAVYAIQKPGKDNKATFMQGKHIFTLKVKMHGES